MFMRIDLTYALFFFNDTATTEIYTLSLHDALPISFEQIEPHFGIVVRSRIEVAAQHLPHAILLLAHGVVEFALRDLDRKSTRLNSSHDQISYAVFCLKKKKTH